MDIPTYSQFPSGPDAERFHILLRPDPSDGAAEWGMDEKSFGHRLRAVK